MAFNQDLRLPPEIWQGPAPLPDSPEYKAYQELIEAWNQPEDPKAINPVLKAQTLSSGCVEGAVQPGWTLGEPDNYPSCEVGEETGTAISLSCTTGCYEYSSPDFDAGSWQNILHSTGEIDCETGEVFPLHTAFPLDARWGFLIIQSLSEGLDLPPSEDVNLDENITLRKLEYTGYWSAHSHSSWFIFRNSPIPRNVRIKKAHIRFHTPLGITTSIFGTIRSLISGSPNPAIPQSPSEAETKERTQYRVRYNIVDNVVPGFFYTPEIQCVIQELIDDNNYETGEPLQIFVDGLWVKQEIEVPAHGG
jgi:hypothetical protein